MNVPYAEKVLPTEKRLKGIIKHIQSGRKKFVIAAYVAKVGILTLGAPPGRQKWRGNAIRNILTKGTLMKWRHGLSFYLAAPSDMRKHSGKEMKQNMKKYDSQLLKIAITNDKLKMEIKLSDLAWLFRNSPDNVADDGEHEFCRVKRGENQAFTEEFVQMLMDESPENGNDTRWGHMFEGIFQELRESAADFLKYYDD